jgi:hypothetical protein
MSNKRLSNDSTKNSAKNRVSVFQSFWLKEEKCKDRLQKVNDITANCTLCKSNFTVKYEGFASVRKHYETN